MESDVKWWRWWRWCPTSEQMLAKAEEKMLEGIHSEYKSSFVILKKGYRIRTIVIKASSPCEPERLPLVMLHGFGAGVALWVMNLDELAKNQTIYAIDVLGFGRSSRPQFPSDAMEAETEFVESIEEWRTEVGLEKFILLGHSFGGYLAASYTISHPERVRHLILADPWGMAEKNTETEKTFQLPLWAKALASIILLFNPLAALRLAGPIGPLALRNVRSDITRKFSRHFDGDGSQVIDYLYHILVQEPSGESAFVSLTIPYGWAKFPMVNRLVNHLDPNIPISVFYGSRSWMHIKSGLELKALRSKCYVHFQLIPEGTHHCYADDAERFNMVVENICEKVDKSLDTHDQLNDVEETYDLKMFDNFGSFLKPL